MEHFIIVSLITIYKWFIKLLLAYEGIIYGDECNASFHQKMESIQGNISLFITGALRKSARENTAKSTIISPNFWCINFVEMHSFRKVSSDLPKTMRKLCLFTKFSHQKIRWNYGILRSENCNRKMELHPLNKSIICLTSLTSDITPATPIQLMMYGAKKFRTYSKIWDKTRVFQIPLPSHI